MKNDENDFLKLAYRYYPKGISDEDITLYQKTPEFQQLTESLRERKYLDDKWQKLLNGLQERFECLDIGVPDRIIRGYRIAIVLSSPKPHYIVVNISKLIPYYCYYTKSEREDLRFSEPGYLTFSDFISSDQEIINWISEQIQFHFEGYKEFPPQLPFVTIEDVKFDERGILLSNKSQLYFTPMTLFNAFFSTNIFY